jgi:predicted metal-dependent hydrolase
MTDLNIRNLYFHGHQEIRLEYVVVHEMVHLIEPTHNERFVDVLSQHYPTWREARSELNELPLVAEVWQTAGKRA